MDNREAELQEWLSKPLENKPFKLKPLAGDASFRRYFRVALGDETLMAVDAPPATEKNKEFVAVSKTFNNLGIRVPNIHAHDLERGFLLIDDFGDRLYLHQLHSENADKLYGIAMDSLFRIQTCKQNDGIDFVDFDRGFIQIELDNFVEWFLKVYLKIDYDKKMLQDMFDILIESATSQPQVCMHRDYHSRNLMRLKDESVGVIDFQDAVWGPVAYDLVSLLRDCYISWPREDVLKWVDKYFKKLYGCDFMKGVTKEQFIRWFDLCGIQRHLKAVFIFARKWERDGDKNYLSDIPRTLNYILEVSKDYPELKPLYKFLKEEVAPKVSEK